MTSHRRFTVLIDDVEFGQVELHANAVEREFAEAAMKLPGAASILRHSGVSETRFDGTSYNISTKPRKEGPYTLAEVSRMPGARLISHPFAGLGIPSTYEARDNG